MENLVIKYLLISYFYGKYALKRTTFVVREKEQIKSDHFEMKILKHRFFSENFTRVILHLWTIQYIQN